MCFLTHLPVQICSNQSSNNQESNLIPQTDLQVQTYPEHIIASTMEAH